MKVDEQQLAQYIAHYKQTAAARKKIWELKHIQNKVQRPSMRQRASAAASVALTGASSGDFLVHDNMSDTESVVSTSSSAMSMGVSAMTYDQHSSLIRYPNSMSNLRRLRCYLLSCQVPFRAFYAVAFFFRCVSSSNDAGSSL